MDTSRRIHFLSAKGRLGMGRFWLYWLLIVLAETGLLVLIGTKNSTAFIFGASIMFFTGLMYLQLIKRMHDVGRSGWYCLVPIYNLILALTNGDEGANEYGPDPKTGSDEFIMHSDVLDRQIQHDTIADDSYYIQNELKNFFIYTIVSRCAYLLIDLWWSYSVAQSSESMSLDHRMYQNIHVVSSLIFTGWLFVLMGRSNNRWLQWIYLIFIAYSALFEILRSLFY